MAAGKAGTPSPKRAGKKKETLEEMRNRLRPIVHEKGEQGAKVVKKWLDERYEED